MNRTVQSTQREYSRGANPWGMYVCIHGLRIQGAILIFTRTQLEVDENEKELLAQVGNETSIFYRVSDRKVKLKKNVSIQEDHI